LQAHPFSIGAGAELVVGVPAGRAFGVLGLGLPALRLHGSVRYEHGDRGPGVGDRYLRWRRAIGSVISGVLCPRRGLAGVPLVFFVAAGAVLVGSASCRVGVNVAYLVGPGASGFVAPPRGGCGLTGDPRRVPVCAALGAHASAGGWLAHVVQVRTARAVPPGGLLASGRCRLASRDPGPVVVGCGPRVDTRLVRLGAAGLPRVGFGFE